jgi:hypothetical protein
MEEKKAVAEESKPKAAPETDKSLKPEAMDKVVGGAIPHAVGLRGGDPCDGSEVIKQ